MKTLSKTLVAAAASAMTVAAVAAPSSTATAAGPAGPTAEHTPYALSASAFGSTVVGGDLPFTSDRSALKAIGCTNEAGKSGSNSAASVNLPGLGSIDGIQSNVSTAKSGSRVTTAAVSKIASVTLGVENVGTLKVRSLRTSARVAKTQSGFVAEHAVAAVLRLKVGPTTTPVDLPTPDHPVVIPGLATIELGPVQERQGETGALAKVNGLVITIMPTSTVVKLGQAVAQIDAGVKSGVLRGNASGERVTVGSDTIALGAMPNSSMPCQGTDGAIRPRSIASTNLRSDLVLSALKTRVSGENRDNGASGFTEGSLGSLSLGDGALEISGVVGRANVTRTGKKVTSNSDGTTVGEIRVNGEPASIPTGGELEIPGVAKLENGPVVKSSAGISVSALKLTILDGSGATILLGNAKLNIVASGN